MLTEPLRLTITTLRPSRGETVTMTTVAAATTTMTSSWRARRRFISGSGNTAARTIIRTPDAVRSFCEGSRRIELPVAPVDFRFLKTPEVVLVLLVE